LIISPKTGNLRQGWKIAIMAAVKSENDELLMADY
jgi:hypothetical protein